MKLREVSCGLCLGCTVSFFLACKGFCKDLATSGIGLESGDATISLKYISHPKANTPILDPIHGNLVFTPFEREVIDSDWYQRLRHILQNSTAYVAYPANRNSRFVHSLGVCNLAGKLFSSAVKHSSSKTLDSFLNDSARFLSDHVIENQSGLESALRGWKESLIGQSEFRHRPFLQEDIDRKSNLYRSPEEKSYPNKRKRSEPTYPALFLIDTLWQAVKICGLIHDIGHLPMSHSFEGALDKLKTADCSKTVRKAIRDVKAKNFGKYYFDDNEFFSDKIKGNLFKIFDISEEDLDAFLMDLPVHERIGIAITNELRDPRKERFEFSGDARAYRKVIFSTAFYILFSAVTDSAGVSKLSEGMQSSQFPSVLRVLKTIVASEVDADRLDYVVRDGHACGSQIGKFDLERIVNNAILLEDNGNYYISYYYRALSGIEQFFSQRRDGYKYLIYHRTSSRSEACLQELIAQTYLFAFENPGHEVSQSFAELGCIEIDKCAGEVVEILPMRISKFSALDDDAVRVFYMNLLSRHKEGETGRLGKIFRLIEIVYKRDFAHIYTPLKNKTIKGRLKDKLQDDFDEDKFKKIVDHFLASSSQSAELFEKITKQFGKKHTDVTVIMNIHKPKLFDARKTKAAEKIYLVYRDGVVTPISEASPLLKNMHKLAPQDYTLMFYFVAENLKFSSETVKNSIDEGFDKIILDYYANFNGAGT